MKKLSGATQYSIVDLGANAWGAVTRVNNDGQVLGYRHFDSIGQQPFLYGNGNFTDLSAFGFYPRALNNHGQIVGDRDNGGREIVIYQNGSTTNLGTLGLSNPSPKAINDQGQIVGEYSQGGGYNAFLYDGNCVIDLYNLTDFQQTVAHDINNLNKVVGRIDVGLEREDDYNEGVSGQSFIYDNGNLTYFGDVGQTQAYGINDSYQAVGITNQLEGGEHAFLYQNGSMINIDTLNSYRSLANAINSSGQVVGLFTPLSKEYTHAFIFDDDVMKDLNELVVDGSEWDYLDEATDINEQGQIVGVGYRNGEQHTFLLTPPSQSPSPPKHVRILK